MERRLIVHFIDLERQKLKNIEGEVHAFGIDPDPARLTAETFEVLTGERLEIPEQPSIAVLPLDNMSGDAKQDLFADGLTEDIITALSHIGGLFVMARNSTFVCKGRSVDVRQVGLDAGRWPLAAGARFGFMANAGSAFAEARALSDKLLEQNTSMADAYDLRGYILTNQGDFEGAIASLKKAVELRPTVSLFHARRALHITIAVNSGRR